MNPPTPAITPPRVPRRAFTLMEMVVSLAIFAIIGLACTSSILLATQAVNAATRPTTTAAYVGTAKSALDTLTVDLRTALRFTEKSPTSVAITVPDRTGDGFPETIAYSWAGAGQPLKRSVNGAAPADVAPSVQALSFGFDSYTAGPPPPPPVGESDETEIYAYHTTAGTSGQNVKNSTWAAEYFKPTFPANTVSWKITRVVVQVRRLKTNITPYAIEIRAVDAAKKPTGAALASIPFDSSTLAASDTWVSFSLATPLDGLDPTKAYCVIVRGTTSSTSALSVRYSNTTASTTRYWTTTTNSGSSWGNPNGSRSMQFYVFGTTSTTN